MQAPNIAQAGLLTLSRRIVQRPEDDPAALVLEAWSQGLMTGSLVIMAAVTFANMRPGVLLHKLILLELILATAHGTFIFAPDPVYGWYLASTAIGLIISWSLHNVIAWMKNRPFMSRGLSLFYIGTIVLAQPYWAAEIYANFAYFNNISLVAYEKIRPWEALFRDPWWIYTTCNLFWVVKTHYNFGLIELVRECPRFGLMLGSMCLSILFSVADVLSVTGVLSAAMPTGINPFWKKLELSRIWEQLERITAVVQGQSLKSSPSPKTQQLFHSLTDHDASIGFPVMVIQNAAFMNLLGLDQSLPVFLEGLEHGRSDISPQPPSTPTVMIDIQHASLLLSAFMKQIYIWYPILHAEYTEEFVQAITSYFPPSVGSCLTLLILAIGCVAECETITDAVQRRPEAIYIQAAMEMLPCVFADSSSRSAQCLLLFSIYHLCCARPCQAHDYVVMASYRLQNYLINELDTDDDTTEGSIFRNCFCEIRVQLDLVDSGIWSVASYAPAPASSATWTWNEPEPFESPNSTNDRSDSDRDLSYFVAEIAMRNMLRRCTWSISTLPHGSHIYAPIVAAELERQLDEWLQMLPEALSFRDSSSCIGSSRRNSAWGKFLRTQYYAFKASIYWPAVYEALSSGEANGDLLLHCSKFFTSYAEFATSAAAAVTVCKPNIWTLYASVFTISMATLAALAEPCLSEVAVLPGVARGLKLAVEILANVADVSPSLGEMSMILNDRVFQGNVLAI
ncbi:hypothetical protein PENFLA_c014G03240 [Penicillium flavigenum]|uniref:Xylanolytic transcriptional activator regulatory domain-containing protein n=1 Tax=Penicillium flavigenum TaxID=254877 RepID=A0A1V6T6A5_9EURO|nr:hypothetical protein PENFLA_c014G03240 [Penicillium flavigenum]